MFAPAPAIDPCPSDRGTFANADPTLPAIHTRGCAVRPIGSAAIGRPGASSSRGRSSASR
ncbi:hypothetical protein A8L33_14115 [Microbacterium aurantiacum]|nr:hypothetical protein A8L33_14115 [Microbacterium chocolatum]